MSGISLMLLGSSMPLSFTYVGSSAVNATSISIPAGSATGDLLVLFDRPIATTVTIPTGFTVINDYDVNSASNYSFGIGYRIQQAGDTSFTSASSRKILSSFRPSQSISLVTVNGLVADTTTASSKTLNINALTSESLQFTTVTHSTGTTSDTPSAGSTETSTFHAESLRAWFSIGQSISLTSTDSNANLMKMFAFGLLAT